MKKIMRIKTVIKEMIPMLNDSKYLNLASSLDRLYIYLDDDPEDAIYRIHSLFGGMGTLNDVVLQKDGKPLVEENSKFNELSNTLYELSVTQ
ncbi:DUF6966 domain-containing protein [Sodalis sp. RH21]|uniref:DUF6966 domain-containing protein n=1 Tax=unclassified Sodalis (in: enterobacteria) TaxID=2636512 RepID=UPI0039B48375